MIQKPTKQTRLLLVDDDPALLRSLVRVMSQFDFEIETATCSAEAAAFMKRASFDVIVCDQNMPGKKGLEFLTQVRAENPDQILMMLSGHVTGLPVAMDWAREIGIYQTFAKPCDANELARVIQIATGTCHSTLDARPS